MSKIKKIMVVLVAMIVIGYPIIVPINTAFAFDEDAIRLNISTSNIEVANTWQKIKNAAVIHLIAQKMKKCVQIKQTLSPVTGDYAEDVVKTTFWPRDEVVNKGNVFKGNTLVSGDNNTEIAVGPWMSSHFHGGLFDWVDTGSGEIHCNTKADSGIYLFDMFVYIMKNYHSGMSISGVASASATAEDRMRVICNGEKPGMLQPANVSLVDGITVSNESCNSGNVKYYVGMPYDQQESYLKSIYENMRSQADNKFLPSWDSLEFYDGVDGFYLYSNDMKVQCGDHFTANDFSNVKGVRVSDNGIVESGSYYFANDTARSSFVGGKKTCTQLVDEMNKHITEYLKFVNEQVLLTCEAGVTSVIEDKRREVQEKYSGDNITDAERSDIDSLFGEYDRIVGAREYMAVKDGDEETLLTAEQMPTDRVWQCRSHLPFVNIATQHEDPIDQLITDEFNDYCYDVMDLAWVVCPVVKGLSDAADGLYEMLEGFF